MVEAEVAVVMFIITATILAILYQQLFYQKHLQLAQQVVVLQNKTKIDIIVHAVTMNIDTTHIPQILLHLVTILPIQAQLLLGYQLVDMISTHVQDVM